jgi:hypothetical protein
MIFTDKELEFIKFNKPVIQSVLSKKLEDILNELVYEEDPIKTSVLKLWAKEMKELIVVLDNFKPMKTNKEKPHTGI